MAEEKAEEVEAQEDPQVPQEDLNDILVDNPQPDGAFDALFEDESDGFTEDQLTGEEGEEGLTEEGKQSADEKDKGSKEKESPQAEEKAAAPEPKGDEKPPEKAEEKEVVDEKPPVGHVPLQALHEERTKRQDLALEVETLRQEVQRLTEEDKAPDEEGFKVLSDGEFQELLDDDPAAAILYDRKLRVHEAKQSEATRQQQEEQTVVDSSFSAMREAIPDLYEPSSQTNKNLTDFAVQHGFNADFLPVLTDPRTKVIPPGGTEPILLGNVAVGTVKMLHTLYGSTQGNAVSREEFDQALITKEKEVTDRVTKELIQKFKAGPTPTFNSLGDVPGSGEQDFDVSRTLTDDQIKHLTPDQKEKYLGG